MNPYMYQEQDDEDLHSNMAGMYEGMDENDDMAPYESISDREPLPEEDSSQAAIPATSATPMQRSPLFDQVSQAVTKRVNPTPPWAQGLSEKLQASMPSQPPPEAPAPPPPPPKNDYGASQYEKGFDDLNRFRRATVNSDFISNFGNAVAQAAQGVNPTPVNQNLYNNMQRQGHDLLVSKTHDLDRRSRIINALENRKMRENIAQKQLQAKLSGGTSQKANDAADFRTDRLLSALGSKFESDPVIKPSKVNLASLNKGRAMLDDRSAPLTSQSLSDIEQDIASALSLRPNALTEGKIKRTEIEDLNRSVGKLKQKFGSSMVDMRQEAPEIVQQLDKVNRILHKDYVNSINSQYESLVNKQKALVDNDRVKSGLDRFLDVSKVEHLPPAKTILKKQYSPSRNQTKIIYDDQSEDLVDGQR